MVKNGSVKIGNTDMYYVAFGKIPERHRRVDAETYPDGILEEREESTHEMEKFTEAWRIQLQCRYSCLLKKRLLAYCR